MDLRASLIALALAGAVLPAAAQDASAPPAETMLACLHAGTSYGVGEFACIAACHQQRRLARCDVVSEGASWTYVSEACPSASINPPWPSIWSEAPTVTAMSPIPVVVRSSAIAPILPLVLATHGL